MKAVYLLLTRSKSVLSRTILCLTRDAYTHVSIGIHSDLSAFYSFARLRPSTPVPAGFVRETLDGGYFGRHNAMPCALYALDVSDRAYQDIASRLEWMCGRADQYRYSVMGLILCGMDLAHERSRHFFSSQFVGDLLERSGAICLPKPPSLMRPIDYAGLPGLRRIYEGQLCGAAYARVGEGEFA